MSGTLAHIRYTPHPTTHLAITGTLPQVCKYSVGMCVNTLHMCVSWVVQEVSSAVKSSDKTQTKLSISG